MKATSEWLRAFQVETRPFWKPSITLQHPWNPRPGRPASQLGLQGSMARGLGLLTSTSCSAERNMFAGTRCIITCNYSIQTCSASRGFQISEGLSEGTGNMQMLACMANCASSFGIWTFGPSRLPLTEQSILTFTGPSPKPGLEM